MTSKIIKPDELKFYWPEIKAGLEKVLQKTPSSTWIPEEIFSALFTKKAICVVGIINDEVVWGFVGFPRKDRVFFVWAAWSEINITQGIQSVIDIAKKLDCKYIKFETDRIGWQKIAPTFGFKPYSWIKEI